MRYQRLCIVVLALWCGSAHAMQQNEELRTKLASRVSEYTLSEPSFVHALAKVSADFKVRMGIELVLNPRAPRKVEFSIRETTVRGVIDSLVGSEGGHDWRVEGGIVHVFPVEVVGDKRNFLNLKIPSFEMRDEFITVAMLRLRGRLKWIVGPPPPPPPGAGEAGSISSGMGDQRVSTKLENVPVRRILDEFLLLAGFRIWLVTFTDTSKLTRAGYFRTATLWHPDPFPDADQPFWTLLVWGQALPDLTPEQK